MLNMQGHTNVELLPFAVSDHAGTLRIAMPDGNSGNAHVGNDGELVRSIVLDHYALGRRVDFMKIDVEGFEAKVLAGAQALIKRDKPVIVIEQKPGNAERYGFKQKDALTMLKSWGATEVAEMSGDHILKW